MDDRSDKDGNVENRGNNEANESKEKTFSRRALLQAGWTAPVILSVSMPQFLMAGSPGHSDIHGDFNFGALTQGYWKNHPENWDVSGFYLGIQPNGTAFPSLWYTQQELLDLLNTSVQGDASINLLHQLVAAKLNVYHGSDPSIQAAINAADLLLGAYDPKHVPLNIQSGNPDYQAMIDLANQLDAYNKDENGHSDAHSDASHVDNSHYDSNPAAHADSHQDSHSDAAKHHNDDHTDSTVLHSDWHGDNTPNHADSHVDSNAHTDYHNDIQASHSDTHQDIQTFHNDSHQDNHKPSTDPSHNDRHADLTQTHTDFHTDTTVQHSDTGGSQTTHGDTHADAGAGVHSDSHTDVQQNHDDTHGDASHGHVDTHGDMHQDA